MQNTSAQHIRNLLRVYDAGTSEERLEAILSYQRYNAMMQSISDATGYSLEIACGVFAALSPNNSYVSNLRNAMHLLKMHKAGKDISEFKVNTYNNNKRKAWLMAGGTDPMDLFKGLKTKAFFNNILDPSNPDWITVDGHMFWAWQGRKGRVKSRTHSEAANVTGKMYREISDGIRLVAEFRNVIPCQAQGVIWQNWRRMHNVMGAQQRELFSSDTLAIGIPMHVLATGGTGI